MFSQSENGTFIYFHCCLMLTPVSFVGREWEREVFLENITNFDNGILAVQTLVNFLEENKKHAEL